MPRVRWAAVQVGEIGARHDQNPGAEKCTATHPRVTPEHAPEPRVGLHGRRLARKVPASSARSPWPAPLLTAPAARAAADPGPATGAPHRAQTRAAPALSAPHSTHLICTPSRQP